MPLVIGYRAPAAAAIISILKPGGWRGEGINKSRFSKNIPLADDDGLGVSEGAIMV